MRRARQKMSNPWTAERMLIEAKQMDMACIFRLGRETDYDRIGGIRLVKEKYETLTSLYEWLVAQ